MKLTARGRTVLAQVSHQQQAAWSSRVPDEDQREIRTEIALLSDGYVGIKHTWLKPDGKVDHTSGWKQKSKLKPHLRTQLKKDPKEISDVWASGYERRGYVRIK